MNWRLTLDRAVVFNSVALFALVFRQRDDDQEGTVEQFARVVEHWKSYAYANRLQAALAEFARVLVHMSEIDPIADPLPAILTVFDLVLKNKRRAFAVSKRLIRLFRHDFDEIFAGREDRRRAGIRSRPAN